MKSLFSRLLPFVLLVVLVLALVSACAPVDAGADFPSAESLDAPPADQAPIEIPELLTGLFIMFVSYFVNQGLKNLSKWTNRNLTGYAAQISGALITAGLLFFNAMLAAVPDPYRPIVAQSLVLLVLILGAFGVHATKKSLEPSKTVTLTK